MASSGKKKTTFAKLSRENRMRERRLDKAARKVARRQAAELGRSESTPETETDTLAEAGERTSPEDA